MSNQTEKEKLKQPKVYNRFKNYLTNCDIKITQIVKEIKSLKQ